MIPVDGLDLFNTMDFGVAFNQWLFWKLSGSLMYICSGSSKV
jgi:hypothetical protein